MPKYSNEKREFQVGEYWLGQRSGSPAWYRMWYDEKASRTKRTSLGTTDFEEAKKLLTDWFITNRTPQQEDTQEVLLADVLLRYWEQHGQFVVSAARTKHALGYWLDFYGEASLDDLKNVELQEKFHAWLLAKGMNPTSVRRVVTAGRAAINRAWKRAEIENAPYILNIGSRESKNSLPKGRPLELQEIATLFGHFQKSNIKIFTLFMLATAARPEAIYQLACSSCDVENRLVDLNPMGRMQNNKHRPVVRMPESIVPLVERLKQSQHFIIEAGGKPVKDLRTAWRIAREHAQLQGSVNPYSLRHTVARWLRKQGVPAWEISAQLGHKRQDTAITEIYAPHDPAYLINTTKAIDIFFAELRAKSAPVDKVLKNDF